MYPRSIFWFRQDLRTHDNRGLSECIAHSGEILPVFILDDTLIEGFGGLSDRRFAFLREALEALSDDLLRLAGVRLCILRGDPRVLIPETARSYDARAVYSSRSYGRTGMSRDADIGNALSRDDRVFHSVSDYLLADPEHIAVRKVFTPYYRLWSQFLEIHPERTQIVAAESFRGIVAREGIVLSQAIPTAHHPYFTLAFGRERLDRHIRPDYDDTRNALDRDGTSRLSPYLRFGVFSVREIHARAREVSESFVRELAWREFWQHIAYHFPETKTLEFQENKRAIRWDGAGERFDRWCRGETGYPIVDAAMRQLAETDWMHGRARMIVASFLTKDLHIDWRLGEAFFRRHLLDYDENVNFGNWQWAASVGADPKPLRIFNPSLQSEKFDPEATYIRRYLGGLRDAPIPAIHHPLNYPLDYRAPIVDHREEQKEARRRYRGEE